MAAGRPEPRWPGVPAGYADMAVIDGHCDTATYLVGVGYGGAAVEPRDIRSGDSGCRVDIDKLRSGGVCAQFFAMFADDRRLADANGFTWRMLEALERAFDGGGARIARSAAEILSAKAGGDIAAVLAIEGGEAIGESLDELRRFYGRGVRLMTLTWNRANAIGRGAAEPGAEGLFPFGFQVVEEMQRLGMIVDASHLSDRALDDLLRVARRPIVASHSNSRALVPHRRNLSDAQVEAIAGTGGLVAATLAGLFVDPDPSAVSLSRFVDHVDRLVSVAGRDHVGIGSDFDGFDPAVGMAIRDCSEMPRIAAELSGRGYSDADIGAIMGGNWLRVVREAAG